MARSAQAPVAQTNIKWFEATFEVDGKSVRVEYLSDRALSNNQIADLVARGQDYGRAWVDDRAQGSASRIQRAAEMVREGGEPTETGVARRATQAEIDRFATGRRTVELAGSAARQVGEWAVETAERVGTAIGIPVPTERTRMERQQSAIGGRRARVVHAMDEISLDAPAEETAAAAPAEEAAPKQSRGREESQSTAYISPYSYTKNGNYDFEIIYDSSKVSPTESEMMSINFWRDHADAVIRFRYVGARSGKDLEEASWFAGGSFYDKYLTLFMPPIEYEATGSTGRAERIRVYVDPEKMGWGREELTQMQKGQMVVSIDELLARGAIIAFSTFSPDTDTWVRWRRGQSIDEHVAFLRGRDLEIAQT